MSTIDTVEVPVPTIGLLYPGDSAADDYVHLTEPLAAHGVQLLVEETSVGIDAHEVDALLDLGSSERLLEGAARIGHRVDALMWACTSGSFVFGWEGAHAQAAEIAERTGRPASSTSLAFVRACRALSVERVAVAASYPQDVAQHFTDFLRAGGIEVVGMSSHDIHTAAQVGTLGRDDVCAIVAGAGRSGAEAVLVPDTAMHSLGWLPDLEHVAGTPVLTANQVTVFDGLGLLGLRPQLEGFGALFDRATATTTTGTGTPTGAHATGGTEGAS
ncbi:maleate cis-trans isomerase family protein [Pseudactinotalea sp. Z1748]|uniref:maleate cis-trans isomerase family protein n=1 Tax=Pseudactinotalea sp. Z1748 TaxID=3413027 RepID=UPI003C7D408D